MSWDGVILYQGGQVFDPITRDISILVQAFTEDSRVGDVITGDYDLYLYFVNSNITGLSSLTLFSGSSIAPFDISAFSTETVTIPGGGSASASAYVIPKFVSIAATGTTGGAISDSYRENVRLNVDTATGWNIGFRVVLKSASLGSTAGVGAGTDAQIRDGLSLLENRIVSAGAFPRDADSLGNATSARWEWSIPPLGSGNTEFTSPNLALGDAPDPSVFQIHWVNTTP